MVHRRSKLTTIVAEWQSACFGIRRSLVQIPQLQFLFYYIFLILLFYLERKTTSRRAGLSAIAEFLVQIVQASIVGISKNSGYAGDAPLGMGRGPPLGICFLPSCVTMPNSVTLGQTTQA